MGRLWVPTGVDVGLSGIGGGAGALAPTLVAGPAVNVAIGGAWIDGHYAELTAPASVPVTASGLVCVRFTPADNRAELLYRDAATVLTMTDATFELPIARMTAGALQDIRWPANVRGELAYVVNSTGVPVPVSATQASPIDVDVLPAVYCDGSPLEFAWQGNANGPNPAGGLLYVRLWMDAAEAPGTNNVLCADYVNLNATLSGRCRPTPPPAGVHSFRARAYMAGAANPGNIFIMHTLAVTRI
jgi:hypothetical protein